MPDTPLGRTSLPTTTPAPPNLLPVGSVLQLGRLPVFGVDGVLCLGGAGFVELLGGLVDHVGPARGLGYAGFFEDLGEGDLGFGGGVEGSFGGAATW